MRTKVIQACAALALASRGAGSSAAAAVAEFDRGVSLRGFMSAAEGLHVPSARPARALSARPDAPGGCRPADRGEIPAPPALPVVVEENGPWDSLGNGLLELRYGSAPRPPGAALYVIARESWEPKDRAAIARAAEADNLRAYLVEYAEAFYVYWASPHALFYLVPADDGGTVRLYKDAEQDGINGNEEFCGDYPSRLRAGSRPAAPPARPR